MKIYFLKVYNIFWRKKSDSVVEYVPLQMYPYSFGRYIREPGKSAIRSHSWQASLLKKVRPYLNVYRYSILWYFLRSLKVSFPYHNPIHTGEMPLLSSHDAGEHRLTLPDLLNDVVHIWRLSWFCQNISNLNWWSVQCTPFIFPIFFFVFPNPSNFLSLFKTFTAMSSAISNFYGCLQSPFLRIFRTVSRVVAACSLSLRD